MNQNEANAMLALVMRLFPQKTGTALSDDEARLFLSMVRNYPAELCRAAIEGHKLEWRGKRPSLAELRRKLLAMDEASRAAGGAGSKSEADRAKWAEWHRDAEAHDETTRAWIAQLSDAEIVALAEAAIEKTGRMMLALFGPEDPLARRRDTHTKPNIDPTRIREGYLPRNMLRAISLDQS